MRLLCASTVVIATLFMWSGSAALGLSLDREDMVQTQYQRCDIGTFGNSAEILINGPIPGDSATYQVSGISNVFQFPHIDVTATFDSAGHGNITFNPPVSFTLFGSEPIHHTATALTVEAGSATLTLVGEPPKQLACYIPSVPATDIFERH